MMSTYQAAHAKHWTHLDTPEGVSQLQCNASIAHQHEPPDPRQPPAQFANMLQAKP